MAILLVGCTEPPAAPRSPADRELAPGSVKRISAAIVDRLLGNATVVNIHGRSYRMRSYHETAEKGAAIMG